MSLMSTIPPNVVQANVTSLKQIFLSPPSLLIVLCVLAVYSLLIFEFLSKRKKVKKLERPLVVLVLMGMFPIVYLPFSLAHPHRLALNSLSATGAITTLVIYVIVIFLLKRVCFPSFPSGLLSIFKEPFLMILAVMVVASSLWSQTPLLALRSSLPFLGVAALAAHFAKRYSWEELATILRQSLTVIAFLSVPIALILPSTRPSGDPWGGILFSSKTLGSLMALNAALWLTCLMDRQRPRTTPILMFTFSIGLVFVSAAKAALVSLTVLLYFVLVLWILQSSKFRQSIIVLISSLIFSIFLTLSVSAAIDIILQALGKDPTFTGRTVFWEQLIGTIQQHPIGYGYNGFWQAWRGTEDPSAFIGAGSLQLGDYRPPHSHNGFMEVGLQIGYIGLLVFFISFLKTTLTAIWNAQFVKGSVAIFPMLILVYLVMSNIAETELLGLIGPNQSWFLYSLIAVKLSLNRRANLSPSSTAASQQRLVSNLDFDLN